MATGGKAYAIKDVLSLAAVNKIRFSNRVANYLAKILDCGTGERSVIVEHVCNVLGRLETAQYHNTSRKLNVPDADIYYIDFDDEKWYVKFAVVDEEIQIHTCCIDGDFH